MNKFITSCLPRLLLLCILCASCVPTLRSTSTFNPDTDCATLNNFEYGRFQIESAHPSRSTKSISEQIQAKREEIASAVQRHSELFPQKNKISFLLIVNAGGSLSITFLPDTTHRDTSFANALKQICKMLKFDSLPHYHAVAKVKMELSNMEFIRAIDSVRYYQERTKVSIMCVVMRTIIDLRRAYNRHLRSDLSLSGKIVVKFGINENGDVIHVAVTEKTIDRKSFEDEVLAIVKSWKFGEINNPGDVTEVVYPFIFSR